jgi:hypothetical protein
MNKKMPKGDNMLVVFQKLGLDDKQIKQANALHNMQKGGAPPPTKEMFQKLFDLDDAAMEKMEKLHKVVEKQNQLVLKKTQKIRGGGEGFMLLSMVGQVAVRSAFLASGHWVTVTAFPVGWTLISTALNKYIDGLPMQDPQLNYISKLLVYVIPVGMIQYIVTKTLLDSYVIQNVTKIGGGGRMSGGMSGGFIDIDGFTFPEGFAGYFQTVTEFNFNAFFSDKTGLTWLLGQVINNILRPVFSTLVNFSLSAGSSLVSAAKGDIVLTAISVAFMGKYMYTRYYGNTDKNKDLDKTLYMNWKRRRMIIKAYENRKTSEKHRLEDRQEKYKQKEEELLKSLEEGEEPIEEKKSEEIVRKNPVWYGYKITDDDRDSLYKSFNNSKSARNDENAQKEDAEFLKKAEEILEKK